MSADNGSWTDWVGKCSLHWSGNPSADVANGIIDNPVTSMNYIIQRPGKVGYKTYSIEALRVAVASGEVQLNWQARNKAENDGAGSPFNVLRMRQRNQFSGCGLPLLHSTNGSAYGSRTRAPALRGLCPNH